MLASLNQVLTRKLEEEEKIEESGFMLESITDKSAKYFSEHIFERCKKTFVYCCWHT
jgi:hypothetical protein